MTGAELKAWRAKKGWTQEALARSLGISTNTLYRWEAGTNKVHRFLPAMLAGLNRKPAKPTK